MNEVYARHVGAHAAGALDGRGREAAGRRARRDRGDRARLKRVEEYVRSLGLDAYVVGGAVRDELLGRESKDADFLVPGVDIDGLRAALAPHGRAEELVVAGRPVGVRLYPRDRAAAAHARAGIELAPPRREVSTGPGPARLRDRRRPVRDRRGRSRPPRLHDQRDGAPALRRHARRSVRRAAATSSARVLRTVSPQSFAEDPLRLVRGLRFVSQLGLDPDEQTLAQMREEAAGVALVSGERIGGGLAADGMGELSKLLLGAQPAKALRLARDTGVLVALLPEFERCDRLRPGEPLPRPDGRRAHLRGRPGGRRRGRAAARAARGALPRPRQAARRVARDRRAAALLREARLLDAEPRAGGRRARGRGARAAALPERAAPARRADRARAHARPGPRRRAARAPAARALRRRARRSTCSTTRRPTCAARATGRATTELERARALPRGRRARAVEPAPAARPRGRRRRPDRARLRARARARAHAAARCSTRSSTTRR